MAFAASSKVFEHTHTPTPTSAQRIKSTIATTAPLGFDITEIGKLFLPMVRCPFYKVYAPVIPILVVGAASNKQPALAPPAPVYAEPQRHRCQFCEAPPAQVYEEPSAPSLWLTSSRFKDLRDVHVTPPSTLSTQNRAGIRYKVLQRHNPRVVVDLDLNRPNYTGDQAS